ncbi:hypothetical protein [Clostridium sp. B9]|uniref:hypothetical protein n=1 Tax=Clostridium sp. B9 TaxID=3423224 RepID=UPI003D2EDBEF
MSFFGKNGDAKSEIEVKVNDEGTLENVEFNEEDVVSEGENLNYDLEEELVEKSSHDLELYEEGELLNPIPMPIKQEENMLDYVVTLSEEQKVKLNELIQANDYAGVGRLLSDHKRIISTPKEIFNIVLNFDESAIIPFKSAMVLGLDEFDAFNVLARTYPIIRELDRTKISIKRINRVQQAQVLFIDGQAR